MTSSLAVFEGAIDG